MLTESPTEHRLLKEKVPVSAGDAYGIGWNTTLLFMQEAMRAVQIDERAGTQ